MYAILKQDNSIGDFETRDIPLAELVHEDFLHLYIPISEGHTLKIGDVWNAETQMWEISDAVAEPQPRIVLQPYQPANAEVAQMISDLQADLIIAGVIS